MNKIKLNLKAIALSLGLAAGMMLPASASAQGVFGDLLDDYYAEKEQSEQSGGVLQRGNGDSYSGLIGNYGIGGGTTPGSGSNDGFIGNFGVGENAPLGSGIAILLGAGLGYVALNRNKINKIKENEQ